MAGLEIIQVTQKQAERQFLELPYTLYRNDPNWVAPLRIQVKDLLNKKKHPFYANAEMECWLAVKDGRTVGRIAGIVDRASNEYHGEQAGTFGFFECENDQEAATRLFETVRQWLATRGIKTVRGPASPSMNYECGLLVEGFDSTPRVMMTYNPPYYASLIEGAGLRKVKDLCAYYSFPTVVIGDRAERVAQRAARSNRVVVRPIRMKAFQDEVERVWKAYNAAWSRNWGFTPMTRDEFFLMARDMKSILVPDFVLLGEVGGRVVGFALALPDINEALKHAKGRLFPFGLLKILYHQRSIKNLRVLALGVVEEYRTAGVAAGFYASLIQTARKLGYRHCEFSWVLEDNKLMNRSLEALGAQRYKTYRIYEWN